MKPQNVTKIKVAGGGVLIPGYSQLVAAENGGVCGVTFGKTASLLLVTALVNDLKMFMHCITSNRKTGAAKMFVGGQNKWVGDSFGSYLPWY